MKDLKDLLEGIGRRPSTRRPSFPGQVVSVDLGPGETAGLGTRPLTPRPGFPSPVQQQQQQETTTNQQQSEPPQKVDPQTGKDK